MKKRQKRARAPPRRFFVSTTLFNAWEYIKNALLACGISARRICRNVRAGPIVCRGQILVVKHKALHAWLEQIALCYLLHGHPGDIIDQLLLRRIVGLYAARWILVEIGLFQCLLHLLLLGCVCRMVLTIVAVIIARTFVELEGGPVLWVIIVGDPGNTPEL